MLTIYLRPVPWAVIMCVIVKCTVLSHKLGQITFESLPQTQFSNPYNFGNWCKFQI